MADKAPVILHLSTAVDWRGGENQLAILYKGLEGRNVKQFLFMPRGRAFAAMVKRGINPKKLIFRNPWFLLDAFRIAAFVRRKKVDIIHAHDAKAHSLAYLAAVLFNCPAKWVIHRRVDNPIRKNRLTKWKYHHPNLEAIICVSNHIKDEVVDYIGQGKKVVTIYSAVEKREKSSNESLHNLLKIPQNVKIVGNISAIDHHKDPLLFIEVAEQCIRQKPDLHFVWIGGDSGLLSSCRDAIRDKQLEDRVHLTGFLENPQDYLQEFDLFLFTSKTEGLGTTLLDALLYRTLVVSAPSGGASEIIQDTVTGRLSSSRNKSQLASMVMEVLVKKEEFTSMIDNGEEMVRRRFNPEQMAANTLLVYQEVVKQ